MKHRFIEAEDAQLTNHGKFSLVLYEPEDFGHISTINQKPLLGSLPPVRRFNGPITTACIWMLDLQTQEGMMFDAEADERTLRRRFLIHPLHVCILYFPVMRAIANATVRFDELPAKLVIDLDDVLNQPGILLDAASKPVTMRAEWSARYPLVARLRNRESLDGVDPDGYQSAVTVGELRQMMEGKPPRW